MMNSTKIRTYSELVKFSSFEERFAYLKLNGKVGAETFSFDRWLNQTFYRSHEWRKVIRPQIIVRDLGCDLGVEGYEIRDGIIIHHMNPIDIGDIINVTDYLLNPEYLICTSLNTHNALHYGNEQMLKVFPVYPVQRRPNDTCPWRN